MIFHQRARRFTAWLALLAILMASLAPTVSHALSTQNRLDAFWTEVCSVAGIKKVVISDRDASAPASPADRVHQGEDCGYCRLQLDQPGLPPPAEPAPLVVDGKASVPVLFYQSHRPLFAWGTVHARAPPGSPV